MILRTRGEERKVRKDGDNLHGVIALTTRHLLKERLMVADRSTGGSAG
jgi:hypothetical protein